MPVTTLPTGKPLAGQWVRLDLLSEADRELYIVGAAMALMSATHLLQRRSYVSVVALRAVEDSDLDALFDQMRDTESVRMAAFTVENPDDRSVFDAHMVRVRNSPDIILRAVTCDDQLVGTIEETILRKD